MATMSTGRARRSLSQAVKYPPKMLPTKKAAVPAVP